MTPADRTAWVLGLPLDGYQKMVLLVLAHRANKDGRCWPSMARIAKDAGISVRKARDVTRQLQAQGLVEVACSIGKATNHYTVNVGANPAQHAALNEPEPGTACRVVALQPGTTRHPTRHHTSFNPAQRADRTGKRTGKEQGAPAAPTLCDVGAGMLGSRKLLGKCIKDYGRTAVLEAIDATDKARPADPKSYLLGILKNNKPQEVPRVSNDW